MNEPTLLFRSDLLASGTTADEIRHALRAGRLRLVTRGVYIDGTLELDPIEHHRVRARAIHGAETGAAVISHVSAAVMHGFDLWDVDLSRVHISREWASGGRRTGSLHLHTTSFRSDEVCRIADVSVTSVARTVVDLARTLPPDQAVASGDSALRMYPEAAASIPDALASACNRNGIAAARRIAQFLDGRSESVGESLSRLRISTAGLPAPVLQYELRTASGAFVARPDFYWKGAGVVGEFDGRGKYGFGEPGVTAETVHREKLREDAIRTLGLEVVRWTWRDLFHFEAVRDRLVAAATRARRR
ncbi:hypothetical protein [Rhodococcus sp. B50]|uniref:hypothetical protein n=1 Tax=Rhodococcus sp. B50 TaxID=2682847 RepID=UPI001BD3B2E0|nr:hypothetical protein [Rhodococcus sp. B50]MBS9375481.1 hypothetical protein [Rhodococcus sp. B50]